MQFEESILGMSILNVSSEERRKYQQNADIYLSPINIQGFKHHAYDVIRSNVNKGVAVSYILERLNIHKEDAIAFGDGMNDKEMLRTVGKGVAMGNAPPELLQYAKYQTTSVNDSGIYNGLKSLGLIE